MLFRVLNLKKTQEESFEQNIEAIIIDSINYNNEKKLFSNLKLAQIDDYYYNKDEKII
jgi:phosphomevalonate kinase